MADPFRGLASLTGVDKTILRLAGAEEALRRELADVIEAGAQLFVEKAASLVPRDSGHLAEMLAHPAAVDFQPQGLVAYAGFTRAVRRAFKGKRHPRHTGKVSPAHDQGVYAAWIEFGTKGRTKGESEGGGGVDGRSASGRRTRLRRRKKKSVPARPAQPFLRPAAAAVFPIIRERRKEAWRRAVGAIAGRALGGK